MTKDEAAKKKGLKVYDYALPQPWVDESVDKLRLKALKDQINNDAPRKASPEIYDTLVSGAVWCYDNSKIFGEPVAVTDEAQALLDLLKED